MASASSTSNINTVPSTNQTSELIAININSLLPIKLTSTNYVAWAKQMQSLLIGYGLLGYVDGSHPFPPAVLLTADQETENPAFNLWFRQDEFILLAILGSCDPDARAVISQAVTSHQAWIQLRTAFANRSRSRVLFLKKKLSSMSKGTSTISDYLRTVKSIADELCMIGYPLDDIDLVLYCLSGLGPDFKDISTVLRTQSTTLTYDQIYDQLLNHELHLKRDEQPSATPVIAHYANKKSPYIPGKLKPTYNSVGNSRPSNSTSSSLGSQQKRLDVCQWCNKRGHIAKFCFKIANNPHVKPNANAITMHPSQNHWLLDSGASHHITNDFGNLSLTSEYPGSDQLHVAYGNTLPISHTGSATLHAPHSSITLPNVLYVPRVKHNLLSVSQLCNENNVSVEFFPSCFKVKALETGTTLLQGPNDQHVYKFHPHHPPQVNVAHSIPSTTQWHHRLGHPAARTLRHVISSSKLPVSSSSSFSCTNCSQNKSHKLPFHRSSLSSKCPLEIVHADVWGPTPFSSIDGFRFYVIFVDHFSRYVWLYPIKHKSDVSVIFPKFKALVENYFNLKIKTLFTDNGGEFIKLRNFLSTHGISHLTTPPHTPEHNGLAEHKHRHLVETARCLLHHAHAPMQFWSFALSTAAFLINRLPTPVLRNSSPFQVLFQQSPNYLKLRTFGCLCFPWLKPYSPHKLAPRSYTCVFLGYSTSQSAYFCFDLKHQKLYTSRHVEFIEHSYPFQQQPTTPLPTPLPTEPVPVSPIPHVTIPLYTRPSPPQVPTDPLSHGHTTHSVPESLVPCPNTSAASSTTLPLSPSPNTLISQSSGDTSPSSDQSPPTLSLGSPSAVSSRSLGSSSGVEIIQPACLPSPLLGNHPMVTRGKAASRLTH
ncbi:hypothetical protein L6164_023645 [Bauhinia variegata]|uniref:Uncharacterized protein n=1 Tax=Bauhinia variegata TaxID=167791 RepID=A0ACB9MJ98_BAUVA|nr:hypothetical protein L6164_023645 [Bauhinia variegata]